MTDSGRPGDLRARRRRRRRSWRGGWISGIRVRVLAIALIPSLVLFITGGIVVVNLISQGVSARDLSGYFVQTNTSSVQYQSAIERERTTSELALGGDRQAQASLQSTWDATNAALAKLDRKSVV